MVDQMRVAGAASKSTSAENGFTLPSLWRLTAWGALAGCALLFAVLAGSGDGAIRRGPAVAALPNNPSPPAPPVPRPASPPVHPFDAQAETRRLSEAIRELAAEGDELKSRVAVVEHSMDDVTGSIAHDIAAGKPAADSTRLPPWPDNEPPVPPTPAAIAAVLAPSMGMSMQYGVDIGSGVNIPTLRARWTGMRSAHPDLFSGLRPFISLKQPPRTKQVELHLMAGPLSSATAAAQLCGSLAFYRVLCQPMLFDDQDIALE